MRGGFCSKDRRASCGPRSVVQPGLELTMAWNAQQSSCLSPPEYWYFRCVSPYLTLLFSWQWALGVFHTFLHFIFSTGLNAFQTLLCVVCCRPSRLNLLNPSYLSGGLVGVCQCFSVCTSNSKVLSKVNNPYKLGTQVWGRTVPLSVTILWPCFCSHLLSHCLHPVLCAHPIHSSSPPTQTMAD